jgi:pantoate--beta-alanine ligase
MPHIVSAPKNWRKQRKALQGSLGFVPTMGNLHEGHLDLVRRALAENDFVLVSIFVNPTQFNQPSDYEAYARTFAEDCAKLGSLEGATERVYVLSPAEKDIYPDGYALKITETEDAELLEGKFRPGHFTGMLTVVMKLLNIAAADRAYFGEKDFQQLLLVRKMAEAFFLPVEIIPCPTRREESGLAMSSRNSRLSAAEKAQAAQLYALLSDFSLTDAEVVKRLEKAGFKPEYVETKWGRRLAAAWLGEVRLIDNIPAEQNAEGVKQHAAVS